MVRRVGGGRPSTTRSKQKADMDGQASLVLGVASMVSAMVLSSARIALNGFSGGRLRKLEETQRELAQCLEPLLERRDEFRLHLRLLQVVAVVVIVVSAAYWDRYCVAEGLSAKWTWVPVVGGGLGFVVLTEAVGKHLSTASCARFLLVVLRILRPICWLLWPLTISQRYLSRWHVRTIEEDGVATAEDEILSLVERESESGEGEASLEEDERRMIRGVFDLDESLVHEIMTPRVDVDGIEEHATIPEIKMFIVESGHSRIPVYRETIDHIVGVVYAKDLLDEERIGATSSLVSIMHPPMFVPETKNVGDLLDEFLQQRNHFAVALDEYGGTAGIVTIEDVLEEIVGEIRDEYDTDEVDPTTEMEADGSLVVDARTPLAEINANLGWDLPVDEDFDTLGGYISAQAGRIPQEGESLETEHLAVEILRADPRRVLQVKVRPRAELESSGEDESSA